MQIVIDIPESEYNRIMASNEVEYFELKIAQGIVLPKGHGDLIDRNYFANRYESCGNEYCEHSDECEECNSRIINKYDVDNAPAVIPADKGE